MRRAFLAIPMTLAASVFGFAACGDDNQNGVNCGPGTVFQNGACVVAPNDTTTSEVVAETSVPTDSSPTTTPTSTTTDATVVTDTTPIDTTVDIDTSGSCTPEEASKGYVGAPCSKDCQCRQDAGGAPLKCYGGIYMQGFNFCTKVAEFNPPTGLYEVTTITMVKGCFPNNVGSSELNTKIYAPVCKTLDDCKKIGEAYDACGTATATFPWATGTGTQCKNFEQLGTGSTMSLQRTCLITTTLPFNQQ